MVSRQAVAATMTFTYLFGAAVSDSTLAQRAKLRDIPSLLREGVELHKVASLVFDIMGPDWLPGKEWMDSIQAIREGEAR